MSAPLRWGAYEIHLNTMITKTVRNARSLGRSNRRARLGHRQHTIEVPGDPLLTGNTIIMHPQTYERLKHVAAHAAAETSRLVGTDRYRK